MQKYYNCSIDSVYLIYLAISYINTNLKKGKFNYDRLQNTQ